MALKFLNDGYFAGKVGIGAESPTVGLQLGNSTLGQTQLAIFNSEGGGEVGLTIKSRTNRAKLRVADNDSNAYVVAEAGKSFFGTSPNGDATNITVLTSGNVGIGTTSPDAILHVKGSTDSTEVRIDTNDNALGDSAFIKFNGARAQVGWIDAAVTLTDGGGNKDIKLKVNTGSIFLQTNNTSRLTVADGGNVGIGTTSPARKLDVAGDLGIASSVNALRIGGNGVLGVLSGLTRLSGTGGASGGIMFTPNNDNTEKMRITSAGNVGIGTTNPGAKLVVTDNINGQDTTLRVNHTRSNSDVATQAIEVDMNLSGADTTTGDRTNSGIRVDVDSTANGDASNEHRVYGVFSTVNFTGFTDLARGGYFLAESNYTSTKTQQLVGVYGQAVHDTNNAAGGVSNMYGVYGIADIQDLGDVDNAFGGYFQVELGNNRGAADFGITKGVEGHININKETTVSYGSMTAVSAVIDNNEGAVPNFGSQYLFKGDYQGDKGNDAYGIYCEGDKHYLEGKLAINLATPTQVLHVAGNARVTGAYYDSNNSPGTANQVLVSTVTGTDWVDGSGSSIIGGPYLPLAGNTTATAMTGDIFLANQQQVRFLTSANAVGLRLQSSGNSGFIDNENGDMYIRQEADNNDMIFQADDGSGDNATYFFLDGSEADGTGNLYTNFPDKSRLTFGDNPNGDLQIYHTGNDSYIEDAGTGDLRIVASATKIYDADMSHFQASFTDGGSVDLYYGGNKKFETTNTGVAVTGEGTFTGDVVINGTIQTLASNANLTISGDTGGNIYYNNSAGEHRWRANGSSVQSMVLSSNLLTVNENATFTGNITTNGDVIIDNSSGDPFLKLKTSAQEYVLRIDQSDSEKFQIRNITSGVTALTINTSSEASFASSVTIPEYIYHAGNASQDRFGFAGNDTFVIRTNGTDKFTADANSAILLEAGITKLQTTSTGIEIAGKATSAATITSDGSSTLTTKGYVNSLITGATIYRGTWDPDVSLNSGYGNPNLNTVTQTSGYYYICSADGAATPNGATTEPNSWNTGDWVIWNDDIGTSGEWQKVDNSSVLSGVGTGQTVALWEGAGTVTDSETLGNAPITVSGNNTNFAGNVTAFTGSSSGSLTVGRNAQENIVINVSDNTNSITANQDSDNNGPHNFVLNRVFAGTGANDFRVQKNGTDQLTIDTNANATFAGDITLNDDLNFSTNGFADISNTGTGAMRFKPSGQTLALTLTGANATFAGSINAPGLVYNATTKYLSISHWSSPPTPAAMLHLSDNSNSLDVPQIRIEGRENPGDTVLDIAVKDADVRFNLVEGGTDASNGYGKMHFKTNANSNSSNPTRGGFLFQTGAGTVIDALTITNEGNSTFAGTIETTKVRSDIMNNKADTANIIYRSGTDTIIGNNANALVVEDGGKVGIGTTTPNAKLQVGATVNANATGISFAAGAAVGNLISRSASHHNWFPYTDGNNYYSADNHIIRNASHSTEWMRVNSSGNVGIGTTSPSARLHLEGDAIVEGVIRADNFNLGLGGAIKVKASNNAVDQYVAFGTTPSSSTGLATFTEKMRITSTGNVGIGTTSPGTINNVAFSSVGLHVKFSSLGRTITEGTSWGEYIMNHSGASANQRAKFTQSKAGNFNLGSYDDNGSQRLHARFDNNGTFFLGNISTAYQTVFFDSTPGTVYGNGTLQISPLTSPGSGVAQFTTNFADRVGSGTTKHNVRVGGTVTATDFIGGSGAYLPLTAGSTKPLSGNLYFSSAASYIFGGDDEILAGQDSSAYYYATGNGQNLTKPVFIGDNNSYIRFNSGNSERMRINSNGTVLINTSAPRQAYSTTAPTKLSVQGGMSEFETTLNNKYDFQNSPISILERANIDSGSADNKYSPNLNFHWSGRVSNSLWMSANGHLNYGSYTSAGIPAADGTIRAGNLNIVSTITANIGAFTGQVTGPTPTTSTSFANKAYVDAHVSPAGTYLPLAGGRMTGTAKIEFNNASQYIQAISNNDLDIVAGDDINYRSNFSRFFSGSVEHARLSGLTNQNNWIALTNTTKLGVGTTSPLAKLDITTSGNTAIPALNAVPGTSTSAIFRNSGNTVILATGVSNTNVAWLQARQTTGTGSAFNIALNPLGGNVGIGTTSPDMKIDVEDNSTTWAGRILNTNSNGAGLLVRSDATTASNFVLGVYGDGGYKMVVRSDGNVGIGVTGPANKLQVGTPALVSGSTYSWPFDLTRVGSTSRGFSIGVGTAGGNVALGNHNGDMSLGQTFGVDSNGLPQFYETMRISHDGTASSGNVGIGDTSPAPYKLSVEANTAGDYAVLINNTHGTTGYGLLARTASTGTSAYALAARAGSSDIFVVRADGNVGIGATSPDSKLDVKGPSATPADGNQTISITNTTGGTQLNLGTAENSYGWIEAREGVTLRNLLLNPNGGNVGIGTTSPSKKLEVVGTIRSNTNGNRVTGNINMGLTTNNTTKWSAITGTQYAHDTETEGFSIINGLSSSTLNAVYIGGGLNEQNAATEIAFWTTSNTNTRTGGIKMKIVSNGNVGIGATSPQRLLHLRSTNQATGIFLERTSNYGFVQYNEAVGSVETYHLGFVNNNNFSSDILVANESGNVGIGTTSPVAKLSLYDATEDVSINVNTGTGGSYPKKTGISFGATSTSLGGDKFTGGAGIQAINTAANNNVTDLTFWTTTGGSPAEKMRIDSVGNVGIGTPSMSRKLQVDAAAGYPLSLNSTQQYLMEFARGGVSEWWIAVNNGDFKFHENGTGDQLIIKAGGNVGIGTTNIGTESNLYLGANSSAEGGQITLQKATSGTLAAHIDAHTAGGKDYMRILSGGDTSTSAAPFVFDLTNVRVGIGTASPDANLEVVGTTVISTVSDGVNAVLIGLAGSNRTTVQFDTADTTHTNRQWGLTNIAGDFYVGRHGLNVMTMLNNGNVGIGTTTPVAKLHVHNISNSYNQSSIIRMGTETTNNFAAEIGFFRGTSSDVDRGLFLNATGSGQSSQQVKLLLNGNVGIGTTSPGSKLQVAGEIRAADGNKGTPSYTFTSDTNTGMYSDTADVIDFTAGGTKSLSVTTSGATVYGSALMPSNAAILLQNQNNNNQYYIRNSGSTNATFQVGQGAPGSNVRLFINGSGNVGIGNTATTASVKLEVTGNTLLKNSNGVGDLYLGNYATANHFRFHTNNSNTFFDMNCGDIYWRQGSSTRYTFFPSTANMTVNGTITQLSDIRNKENIVEIGDCINKVQAMRGVYYNRTDINTEVTKVGVIAQEVENVLPELIIESPQDGLKSVAYSELTAVLINAIKEQQEIIEDLKTRITKLEN